MNSSLLVTGVFLTLIQPQPEPQPQPDRESFLKTLQARDRTFDNVHAKFERSETELVEANSSRDYTRMKAGTVVLPAKLLKHVSKNQIVVRGPNVTFIRDMDWERTETAEGYPKRSSMSRWTNKGGESRSLWDTGVEGGMRYRYETKHSYGANAMVWEQLFETEFAFGLGFAKRMSEITSLQASGTGWVVEGTIKIWNQDVSTCRLEIDADSIVRKAEINTETEGNLWRFEAETAGTLKTSRLTLPKTGTYRRFSLSTNGGTVVRDPKPCDEFSIEVKSVRYDLPDKYYDALTNIRPVPNTYIIDGDSGVQSIMDSKGQIEPVNKPRTAPAPKPTPAPKPKRMGLADDERSGVLMTLILAPLLLYALGAICYLLFRRRKKLAP
jgi:hypothetical protein